MELWKGGWVAADGRGGTSFVAGQRGVRGTNEGGEKGDRLGGRGGKSLPEVELCGR